METQEVDIQEPETGTQRGNERVDGHPTPTLLLVDGRLLSADSSPACLSAFIPPLSVGLGLKLQREKMQ